MPKIISKTQIDFSDYFKKIKVRMLVRLSDIDSGYADAEFADENSEIGAIMHLKGIPNGNVYLLNGDFRVCLSSFDIELKEGVHFEFLDIPEHQNTGHQNNEQPGFYFQLIRQVSGPFYLITPKAYYDKEGALSDESGIADAVVPKGFYELTESTYEFEGSPEVGRQLLIDNGFTEIDFGLHNQVKPMESSDDDVVDYREDENYRMNNDVNYFLNETPAVDEFDYKNMATDKLLRHIRMMIISESFEEAEKIKVELHSRGVTEF